MSSLYTPDVRNYLHSRDWPSGLVVEFQEILHPEPHINIEFYRDNWLTLDFNQHEKITAIVKEVMFKLWSDGIPTYVGKMKSTRERDESLG